MRLTLARTLQIDPGLPQDEVREAWLRLNPGLKITLPCGPPAEVCDFPDLENIEGKRWTCPNCGSRYRKSWRRGWGWIALKAWWVIAVQINIVADFSLMIYCLVFGSVFGMALFALAVAVGTAALAHPRKSMYRKRSSTF